MCESHLPGMVCFRCSNQFDWWRDVRKQDAFLCNCQSQAPKRQRIKLRRNPRCIDCNKRVAVGPRCGSCGQIRRHEERYAGAR